MTRYLLGQLPAAERDMCEQAWFVGKERYDQLCEAENALIDAYVRGALRSADRALFEQHFLTIPARRERVQTARVLMQTIDQPVIRADPWWQRWRAFFLAPKLIPALALAPLALLLGGLWLFEQRHQLRQQLANSATAAAEQQRRVQELEQSLAAERAANARLSEELARSNNPSTPSPTASVPAPRTLLFTLLAGVLRSDSEGGLKTLANPPGVERVRLQVGLPTNDYTRFAATLRTADGNELARWGTVKAAKSKTGTSLTLEVAAPSLKPGDYVLVVSGINARREVEEFRRLPFKVSRGKDDKL